MTPPPRPPRPGRAPRGRSGAEGRRPSGDQRLLPACIAFTKRLPKPYRRIPQPWHFIAKAVTTAAVVYVFRGPLTQIAAAVLSTMMMLGIGAFGLAMILGMFKSSGSASSRRDEERWYEDNDPRGNGPRGAL